MTSGVTLRNVSVMQSFSDIIDRLGGSTALARALDRPAGTVRQWRNRNSVPAWQWSRLVSVARARGLTSVTPEALAEIAASRPPASQKAAGVAS